MLEGGTSDGDVSADIHPSERVQEMEGGEVDTELAWLARWRATKDDSPWLLRRAGQRGRRGICLASMHMGNYEPKAVLVELGVGCERARRKGSNNY